MHLLYAKCNSIKWSVQAFLDSVVNSLRVPRKVLNFSLKHVKNRERKSENSQEKSSVLLWTEKSAMPCFHCIDIEWVFSLISTRSENNGSFKSGRKEKHDVFAAQFLCTIRSIKFDVKIALVLDFLDSFFCLYFWVYFQKIKYFFLLTF